MRTLPLEHAPHQDMQLEGITCLCVECALVAFHYMFCVNGWRVII